MAYQELLRRIQTTSSSRFNASRRLGKHKLFSQWSITFGSFGLILIPLYQAFGAAAILNTGELNVIQVVMAIFILLYSNLLSSEDYSLKSDKMHTCSLELNKLAREVEFALSNPLTAFRYQSHLNEYFQILSKYENHKPIDFRMVRLEKPLYYFGIVRDGKTELNKISFYMDLTLTNLYYWIRFAHYFIIIALIIIVTIAIFK